MNGRKIHVQAILPPYNILSFSLFPYPSHSLALSLHLYPHPPNIGWLWLTNFLIAVVYLELDFLIYKIPEILRVKKEYREEKSARFFEEKN